MPERLPNTIAMRSALRGGCLGAVSYFWLDFALARGAAPLQQPRAIVDQHIRVGH